METTVQCSACSLIFFAIAEAKDLCDFLLHRHSRLERWPFSSTSCSECRLASRKGCSVSFAHSARLLPDLEPGPWLHGRVQACAGAICSQDADIAHIIEECAGVRVILPSV